MKQRFLLLVVALVSAIGIAFAQEPPQYLENITLSSDLKGANFYKNEILDISGLNLQVKSPEGEISVKSAEFYYVDASSVTVEIPTGSVIPTMDGGDMITMYYLVVMLTKTSDKEYPSDLMFITANVEDASGSEFYADFSMTAVTGDDLTLSFIVTPFEQPIKPISLIEFNVDKAALYYLQGFTEAQCRSKFSSASQSAITLANMTDLSEPNYARLFMYKDGENYSEVTASENVLDETGREYYFMFTIDTVADHPWEAKENIVVKVNGEEAKCVWGNTAYEDRFTMTVALGAPAEAPSIQFTAINEGDTLIVEPTDLQAILEGEDLIKVYAFQSHLDVASLTKFKVLSPETSASKLASSSTEFDFTSWDTKATMFQNLPAGDIYFLVKPSDANLDTDFKVTLLKSTPQVPSSFKTVEVPGFVLDTIGSETPVIATPTYERKALAYTFEIAEDGLFQLSFDEISATASFEFFYAKDEPAFDKEHKIALSSSSAGKVFLEKGTYYAMLSSNTDNIDFKLRFDLATTHLQFTAINEGDTLVMEPANLQTILEGEDLIKVYAFQSHLDVASLTKFKVLSPETSASKLASSSTEFDFSSWDTKATMFQNLPAGDIYFLVKPSDANLDTDFKVTLLKSTPQVPSSFKTVEVPGFVLDTIGSETPVIATPTYERKALAYTFEIAEDGLFQLSFDEISTTASFEFLYAKNEPAFDKEHKIALSSSSAGKVFLEKGTYYAMLSSNTDNIDFKLRFDLATLYPKEFLPIECYYTNENAENDFSSEYYSSEIGDMCNTLAYRLTTPNVQGVDSVDLVWTRKNYSGSCFYTWSESKNFADSEKATGYGSTHTMLKTNTTYYFVIKVPASVTTLSISLVVNGLELTSYTETAVPFNYTANDVEHTLFPVRKPGDAMHSYPSIGFQFDVVADTNYFASFNRIGAVLYLSQDKSFAADSSYCAADGFSSDGGGNPEVIALKAGHYYALVQYEQMGDYTLNFAQVVQREELTVEDIELGTVKTISFADAEAAELFAGAGVNLVKAFKLTLEQDTAVYISADAENWCLLQVDDGAAMMNQAKLDLTAGEHIIRFGQSYVSSVNIAVLAGNLYEEPTSAKAITIDYHADEVATELVRDANGSSIYYPTIAYTVSGMEAGDYMIKAPLYAMMIFYNGGTEIAYASTYTEDWYNQTLPDAADSIVVQCLYAGAFHIDIMRVNTAVSSYKNISLAYNEQENSTDAEFVLIEGVPTLVKGYKFKLNDEEEVTFDVADAVKPVKLYISQSGDFHLSGDSVITAYEMPAVRTLSAGTYFLLVAVDDLNNTFNLIISNETSTGIWNVESEEIVYARESRIYSNAESFEVYTITGVNVTRQNGNLPSGVYIVKTAQTATKVAVN